MTYCLCYTNACLKSHHLSIICQSAHLKRFLAPAFCFKRRIMSDDDASLFSIIELHSNTSKIDCGTGLYTLLPLAEHSSTLLPLAKHSSSLLPLAEHSSSLLPLAEQTATSLFMSKHCNDRPVSQSPYLMTSKLISYTMIPMVYEFMQSYVPKTADSIVSLSSWISLMSLIGYDLLCRIY